MSTVMLVTGASSGIGEATARRLAREANTSLVLVARREERLRSLALELAGTTAADGDGGRVSYVAVDLLDEDAPARIRDHVAERHGCLHLLVNNAGASWRARFADGGYDNVQRTMAINFDAPVRLTEVLLPLLRASAPSAIVNVASTASRVARAGTGAYSASKFALAGWSDALWAEERAHGVHVGLVLPGFIATEGFPATGLTTRPWTQWIVSTPERAAEAIYQAGVDRRPERYVPRAYALAGALRVLAPALVRRVLGASGASAVSATTTNAADLAERRNGKGPGAGTAARS
jgi:uncharacterized protein